jgi:hypothetical protein
MKDEFDMLIMTLHFKIKRGKNNLASQITTHSLDDPSNYQDLYFLPPNYQNH